MRNFQGSGQLHTNNYSYDLNQTKEKDHMLTFILNKKNILLLNKIGFYLFLIGKWGNHNEYDQFDFVYK